MSNKTQEIKNVMFFSYVSLFCLALQANSKAEIQANFQSQNNQIKKLQQISF